MGVLPIDTREALHLHGLHSRATCYSRNYGYYRCNSAWSRFGRWILAGLLIFVGLLFMFVFLCISKRRTRRNQINSGAQPIAYAQPAPNYNPPPPAQNYNYAQPPPQSYAPPAGAPPPGYSGDHAGANQDYYGTSGVTQPGHTYAK